MAEKTRTTISETTVTSKGNTYTRYLVRYDDEESGKRRRKTFATRAKAEKFVRELDHDVKLREERQKILRRRIGEDAEKLSAEHLRDAVQALAVLAGRGTLTGSSLWPGTQCTPFLQPTTAGPSKVW